MQKLRNVRASRKMSQADLAAASGVKQSTISMLELGARANPRVSTIQKLALALGCTLDDLVKEDNLHE